MHIHACSCNAIPVDEMHEKHDSRKRSGNFELLKSFLSPAFVNIINHLTITIILEMHNGSASCPRYPHTNDLHEGEEFPLEIDFWSLAAD